MIGVSEHPAPSIPAAWNAIVQLGTRLRSSPADAQPRLEMVGALATLGLRSLAIHEIQTLIEQGVPLSDLTDHLQQIEALPDDCVPTERSASILRANLDAIGWNPEDRAEVVARWRAVADSEIRFRAVDGNLVRFRKAQGAIDQMQDARGAYRKMLEAPLSELAKRQRGPIILDGINPPWILERFLEDDAQPPVPAFRQRVYVVQRDPVVFCEGLSYMDLSDRVGDTRIEWFIGDDAADRLTDSVNQRPGTAHSILVIANPANPDPLAKPLQEGLLRIGARDAESNLAMSARINERYEPRDRAYWSARFADHDARLRILIPTSRYTTYLQYACADLRDALGSMGHECVLLTEPDDSSLMISSDYLNAIDRLDPDLVISMNHTRGSFNGLLPKNLPVLTWIQDAMGHLFSHETGESIGELDFVVGMVQREFIEKFGFNEQQTLWYPMVASGTKFTANTPRKEHSTEIAYVSHQSESVDQQCERLVRDFVQEIPDREPELRALIDRVKEIIVVPGVQAHPELNRALDECFFPDSDPSSLPILRANLLHGMVIPIAERIFRHETIRWAVDIAERRGWSLKLYGNGWDKHPEFASYAAGPVEHGPALASCYRDAAVHLHASIQQPLHQRVTECLLSGGLPITRVLRDAFAVINNEAVLEGTRTDTIEKILDDRGNPIGGSVRLADNRSADLMVRTLRSLDLLADGEFADGKVQWMNKKIQDARRDGESELHRINAEQFAAMIDLFFTNERTLEALLTQAIENPQWREQARSRTSRSIPDTYTMDGFARTALGFIRDWLAAH